MTLESKMAMIFTQEDINRVSIRENGNNQEVAVDLHGFSVKEAEMFVDNVIALDPGAFRMDLIHGYNHGTAIKEMVNTPGMLRSRRIRERKSPAWNPGLTTLTIDSAF